MRTASSCASRSSAPARRQGARSTFGWASQTGLGRLPTMQVVSIGSFETGFDFSIFVITEIEQSNPVSKAYDEAAFRVARLERLERVRQIDEADFARNGGKPGRLHV